MGQIIEKYQRDSRFLTPVSSSRLIADGETKRAHPPPNQWESDPGNVRKSQPLGIKSRPIIDKRLRDNYSRFIIFGGSLCVEGKKISMVHSIFFSITRDECDICIGQVCVQSIYNLLSRLIYYYHCRKLVGVLLYRCDKRLNCLRGLKYVMCTII